MKSSTSDAVAVLSKVSENMVPVRAAIAEARRELKSVRDLLALAVKANDRDDGATVAVALEKFGKLIGALSARQDAVDSAIEAAADSVKRARARIAGDFVP